MTGRGRNSWAVADQRLFTALVGAVVALAWLVLWVWGQSPYARYLEHGELAELSSEGGVLFIALVFVAGWTLMTVAMMLPSSLPLITLFRTLVRQRPDRTGLVVLLIAGYLGMWALFGVMVYIGHWGLHEALERSRWLQANAWVLGAATLVLAGLYQFTPLKYHCLDKCRSPLSFIMEHWRGSHEQAQAFRLGAHHGLFCIGCCWSLMLLMFVVGMGNIGWMLALGAVMAVEKNMPWGRRLGAPLGAVLIVGGLTLALVTAPHDTLTVGTLHTTHALPLGLAASADKPIFEENRLTVSIVYFEDRSQMEAALVAGEIDAALGDLASAVLLNKHSEQVKVVLTAMRSYPDASMWAIVNSPEGAGTTPAELEGQRVAIPDSVAARYVGHRLLEAGGVDPGKVSWLEVADGWQALSALDEGRASAALLPQPALSVAMVHGATALIDDRETLLGQLAILFGQRVVQEKPRAIHRFTRAYEQSMWEVNRNAEDYRPLMVEVGQLPPDIGERLPMPLFPYPADVPTESEVEAIGLWLLEQGMLSQPVPYSQVVVRKFRPPPEQFKPASCCF